MVSAIFYLLQPFKGKYRSTKSIKLQIHQVQCTKLNDAINLWDLFKTEIAHLTGNNAL